jgi:Fe-S cluster assembly iron-binding protein IscA
MLTLTPTAAEVVRSIVADEPDAGLRISPGPQTETGTALEMSLVVQPEATDKEIDEGGATIYLEPQVAELLDDKVLDAVVEDGTISFSLRDQDFDPGANGAPPT